MILTTYNSQLDKTNLIQIASTFVDKNEGRGCTFRRFLFSLFLICTDQCYVKSLSFRIISSIN